MRIVLFGTGNMATRLGIALQAKTAEIVQVYGRNDYKASLLADRLGCTYTTSLKEINTTAELYLLAVSDEAITAVASSIPAGNRLIVHTAGSVDLAVLSPFSINYGVLYPLQTLSISREADFKQVPFCLEANNSTNLKKLKNLAELLSEKVVSISSEQRRQLHLAAVFVCNFVNHFYAIGERIVGEKQLDFGLLKPLILETALKVQEHSPQTVQTGPAVRGNRTIMDRHLKMLSEHPDWQELYALISDNIKNNHQ